MSSPDDDRPDEGAQTSDAPHADETSLGLEIGGVYAVALALILGLTFAGNAVPFISQNLYALVAAVFVGVPYVVMKRRGLSFERFGLTWEDWKSGAMWGLAFSVATLLPFLVGYWVWATQMQDQTLHVSVDNYYQWEYDLEGRPTGWGDEPGAWLWTRDQRAHIGLRAGEEPIRIRLTGDRPFDLHTVGAVQTSAPLDASREVWTLSIDQARARGQVILGRHVDDVVPRNMTVEVQSPDSAVIYAGPDAVEHGTLLRTSRGLIWIVLWIATQLMFIALPEEFFYRGFVQTRIADFLKRRRRRRGKEGELPSVFGFRMPNVITSALFAAGHFFVPVGGALLANRAAVFFPSLLFGWLRDKNGHISGAVVYHAASNMMVLMTAPHFL